MSRKLRNRSSLSRDEAISLLIGAGHNRGVVLNWLMALSPYFLDGVSPNRACSTGRDREFRAAVWSYGRGISPEDHRLRVARGADVQVLRFPAAKEQGQRETPRQHLARERDLAELLRDHYVGRWVAIRGHELVASANTSRELYALDLGVTPFRTLPVRPPGTISLLMTIKSPTRNSAPVPATS
jgi:hypothetical protein